MIIDTPEYDLKRDSPPLPPPPALPPLPQTGADLPPSYEELLEQLLIQPGVDANVGGSGAGGRREERRASWDEPPPTPQKDQEQRIRTVSTSATHPSHQRPPLPPRNSSSSGNINHQDDRRAMGSYHNHPAPTTTRGDYGGPVGSNLQASSTQVTSPHGSHYTQPPSRSSSHPPSPHSPSKTHPQYSPHSLSQTSQAPQRAHSAHPPPPQHHRHSHSQQRAQNGANGNTLSVALASTIPVVSAPSSPFPSPRTPQLHPSISSPNLVVQPPPQHPHVHAHSTSLLAVPTSHPPSGIPLSRVSSHGSNASGISTPLATPTTPVKQLPLTRTQIEIREKVMALLQILVTHHCHGALGSSPSTTKQDEDEHSLQAAFGIVKGCSSACLAYGLSFSALLGLKYVGDHSVMYWAVVKRGWVRKRRAILRDQHRRRSRRHSSAEEETGLDPDSVEDPLLKSLFSFVARPLDPSLLKELRRACLATNDNKTWRLYLATEEVTEAERTLLDLTNWEKPQDVLELDDPYSASSGSSSMASALLPDATMAPNSTLPPSSDPNNPNSLTQNQSQTPADPIVTYTLGLTLTAFENRMRVLKRVETSFVCVERLWRLVIRDENVVEIELGEDSGGAFVDASLVVFKLRDGGGRRHSGRTASQPQNQSPPRHGSTSSSIPGSAYPDEKRPSALDLPIYSNPSPHPQAHLNSQHRPPSHSSSVPHRIPQPIYPSSPLVPLYSLTLRSPSHAHPLLPPPSSWKDPTGRAAWKDADVAVKDLLKDMEKGKKRGGPGSGGGPSGGHNSASAVGGASEGKGKGKENESSVRVDGRVGNMHAVAGVLPKTSTGGSADGDSGTGVDVPNVVKDTKKGRAEREKGRVVGVSSRPFVPDHDGRLRLRLTVRLVRPEKESNCVVS